MPAKQNERRDIPAHHKDPGGHPHKSRADRTDTPQVFRRQEQRSGAVAAHKATVQRTEQDAPKYQQDLMPSELQKKKLDREKIVNGFKDSHHTITERLTDITRYNIPIIVSKNTRPVI